MIHLYLFIKYLLLRNLFIKELSYEEIKDWFKVTFPKDQRFWLLVVLRRRLERTNRQGLRELKEKIENSRNKNILGKLTPISKPFTQYLLRIDECIDFQRKLMGCVKKGFTDKSIKELIEMINQAKKEFSMKNKGKRIKSKEKKVRSAKKMKGG